MGGVADTKADISRLESRNRHSFGSDNYKSCENQFTAWSIAINSRSKHGIPSAEKPHLEVIATLDEFNLDASLANNAIDRFQQSSLGSL